MFGILRLRFLSLSLGSLAQKLCVTGLHGTPKLNSPSASEKVIGSNGAGGPHVRVAGFNTTGEES